MTTYRRMVRRFTEPTVLRSPTDGATSWETAHPVDAGFHPDLPQRLAAALQDGSVSNLHGLTIVRNGRLVLEHYGEGEDFSWGRAHGVVRFTPETLHDVRSATKSVIALLYGIALGAGQVPAPEEPLLAQLPEYPDLAANGDPGGRTVAHALTMTLGIDWVEDVPYTDLTNGEVAMMLADDRWRYILERPAVEQPGTRWSYCGGATELLGRIVAKGTGMPLPEYAHRVLLAPIGIGSFEWLASHDRIASAASGLRLTPRDLARVGQLVLAGGRWQDRQVVPADWLAAMLEPRWETSWGDGFGYQWYVGGSGRQRWVGANGNGDQRLFVLPELDLVVAVTAGNYEGDGTMPPRLLEEVILPSVS